MNRRSAFHWTRLLLCAGLGLVTTVAVAWSLARWVEPLNGAKETEEVFTPGIYGDPGTSRTLIGGNIQSRRVRGAQIWMVFLTAMRFREVVTEPSREMWINPGAIPPWCRTPVRRFGEVQLQASTLGTQCLVIEARGWPRLALACEHEYPSTATTNGIPLGLPARDWGFPTCFPYRPIWSGLTANTGLYAAAWWLLLLAPGVTRRTLRRRRGACLQCGYDLRALPAGSPCPECGP